MVQAQRGKIAKSKDNTMNLLARSGLFIAAILWLGTVPARAAYPDLANLPLVASNAVPRLGSFHRLTKANWPPLPIDNCPGCPVYALGGNAFLIDDTTFDYAARDAEMQAAQELRAAAQQAGVGGEMDALLGPARRAVGLRRRGDRTPVRRQLFHQ
jgi:hypothetical protein